MSAAKDIRLAVEKLYTYFTATTIQLHFLQQHEHKF